MGDSWLSDFGLRVTNLEQSVRFYCALLDLEEWRRVAATDGAYVWFRDRRSGGRFDLNRYAESNPFRAPSVPGKGPDLGGSLRCPCDHPEEAWEGPIPDHY